MSDAINFQEDIDVFVEALQVATEELAQLEKELRDHEVKTVYCRESLEDLKDFIAGKPLRHASSPRPGKVTALDVNPITNRPKRGKRREQLIEISKRLGRGKKVFRTIDVINELQRVEGSVSKGVRSYTYAAFATFEAEGFVEKVGRGKWRLA